MKYEKWFSGLTGAVLAMLLSYGAAGAIVTAFHLTAVNMPAIAVCCAVFSVFCAVCFTVKRGGLVLLGVLALLTGFLWKKGEAVSQTLSLIQQISKFYDGAYGWGIFPYGSPMGQVNYPLGILGALIAITINWTVCRRQSLWSAAAAALIPICACLVVTDTVPDETYLYLILLGFLILVMTNTVRRKNITQGVTLTAIVTLPLALALGLMFWLAPQKSYVNHVPDYQQQAVELINRIPETLENIVRQVSFDVENDRTETVDLDNIGPRPELKSEVMKVFGTAEGTLYLRGQDFSLYTGTGWVAGQQPTEVFPADTEILEAAGAVTIETKRVRNVLYLPYYPMDAGTMSGCYYNTDNIKRYVFTRGTLPEGWQTLSYRSGKSAQEAVHRDASKENYLYLPDSTRQWAQDLIGTLTDREMSRTEQANAIAAFVKSSARYDLNTRQMPDDRTDFAQWFLEESDTGYCVHYATTAAVLLRAAGIPARYVTGYLTQVKAGKTVTVTAADAHAWVEYYEPVLDMWIVLEATPSDDSSSSEQSTENSPGSEPTQSTTATDNTGSSTVPAEDATDTNETTTPVSGEDTGSDSDLAWLGKLLGWIFLLAALICAVPAQRILRLRLRKRKYRDAQPNQLALLYWQEAVLHSRLLRRRAPRVLETLAQKAKYSQHILKPEELDTFRHYIAEAQSTLKARPWYWQLLLRYVFLIY